MVKTKGNYYRLLANSEYGVPFSIHIPKISYPNGIINTAVIKIKKQLFNNISFIDVPYFTYGLSQICVANIPPGHFDYYY